MSKYSINKSEGNTTHGVCWGQQYFGLHANKITVINTRIVSAFLFPTLPFLSFMGSVTSLFVILVLIFPILKYFRASATLIYRTVYVVPTREGLLVRYFKTKRLIDFLINCQKSRSDILTKKNIQNLLIDSEVINNVLLTGFILLLLIR